MSAFQQNTMKNNASVNYKTEYFDNHIPINQKNSIYFRDTIKQFCPHQRYVDHRPNPFRNFVQPPTNFNYYNNPTEKDTFIPCYNNYPRRELLPLVTRQDLSKYLKNNGRLYKHNKPCKSCSRINEGNYGRNYYTIYHKSFPFINGNFTGTNFRIKNKFVTPYQTRNIPKPRYDNNYQTNYEANIDNKNDNNVINNENEKNNETEIKQNQNETNVVDSKNMINNFSTKFRRSFHKTQIFNHYKPFMVDDFKEFADYE
jgi:hypothetical protein